MFDDRSTIYVQIAERIRDDVIAGTLGADDQVMSTTQYAAFYGINPATAARAFRDLTDEGVLYKRRYVGMFVSPDAAERLRGGGRAQFFDDVFTPVVDQAVALGIPLEELQEQLARRLDRKRGGAPSATIATNASATTSSATTASATTAPATKGDPA
ncbi:GntR family transcriptional regulator [soil metagenome]